MFGFRGPSRRSTPLDELKERLSLPALKDAEVEVRNFYEGRNPFEHLKEEWPVPYAEYVTGFAVALQNCRRDGIVDWQRQEVIASMTGIGMARASFANKNEAA
jgi:hypothetical protein